MGPVATLCGPPPGLVTSNSGLQSLKDVSVSYKLFNFKLRDISQLQKTQRLPPFAYASECSACVWCECVQHTSLQLASMNFFKSNYLVLEIQCGIGANSSVILEPHICHEP